MASPQKMTFPQEMKNSWIYNYFRSLLPPDNKMASHWKMASHRKMASRKKTTSLRKWLLAKKWILPENVFSPENGFSPKMAYLPKITFPQEMKNSWTDIELFSKSFPQKIRKIKEIKNYFLRLSLSQGTAFSALYGTWGKYK